MDIYSATEEAYKRGFRLGYEVGKKESAEVMHGHWIMVDYWKGSRMCSVCNGVSGEYHYCPHCGAKMNLEG